MKLLSRVQLLATPWTAAYQAPPPMGFSRQEYWSGVPLPSPSQIPRVKKKKKKRGSNQIRMTTSLREQQEWDAHNSHMRVRFAVDQPGFG